MGIAMILLLMMMMRRRRRGALGVENNRGRGIRIRGGSGRGRSIRFHGSYHTAVAMVRGGRGDGGDGDGRSRGQCDRRSRIDSSFQDGLIMIMGRRDAHSSLMIVGEA